MYYKMLHLCSLQSIWLNFSPKKDIVISHNSPYTSLSFRKLPLAPLILLNQCHHYHNINFLFLYHHHDNIFFSLSRLQVWHHVILFIMTTINNHKLPHYHFLHQPWFNTKYHLSFNLTILAQASPFFSSSSSPPPVWSPS